MKELITIVALTASVLATPALAQSFDPDVGTGNVQSFSYAPTAQQNAKIAGRQNGRDAFAMVPQASWNTDVYSPAETGGGSEGYNQKLMIH
jgi:hypothetical protein